jgi:hypothetical protein
VFAYFKLKASEPPETPYAVQAYFEHEGVKYPTRYYYAEQIKIDDGKAILINYWTLDGNYYHKHTGEKEISQPYKIVKRS